MSPYIKIIHKVWIQPFYERHAALLFFVFYFMFGLVESSQLLSYHLSLIYAALNSAIVLALLFCLWALYLTKAILSLESCIALPQNLLLRQFGLFSKRKQFLLFCYTILLTYEPVFVYSMVMIVIAFKNQLIWSGIGIIVFHFVAIAFGAWRIVYVLNSSSPSLIHIPVRIPSFVKPFPFFYIGLLLDRFKITLLLTKIFSVLCIIGFLQIPIDHYEPRIAFLGLTFGLLAHSVIVFEWRRFEDNYLFFVRGLPIGKNYLFGMLMVAYAILLIPECFVFLVQGVHPIDVLPGLLTGVSFLVFAHCSLYHEKPNNEKHMQNMFLLFILSFFLILCKAALPAAVIALIISFWKRASQVYFSES